MTHCPWASLNADSQPGVARSRSSDPRLHADPPGLQTPQLSRHAGHVEQSDGGSMVSMAEQLTNGTQAFFSASGALQPVTKAPRNASPYSQFNSSAPQPRARDLA